jgi:diguanylate cyclase (GGDEF)-like protein
MLDNFNSLQINPRDSGELGILHQVSGKDDKHQPVSYNASINLPYRTLFLDRLSWFIRRAEKRKENLVMLHVAFDQIIRVSHTLGPDITDQIVTEIAERMNVCIHHPEACGMVMSKADEMDTLFRVAGEEFSIVCPAMAHSEQAKTLANRILQIMEHPLNAGSTEVYFRPGIGIASYPKDATDATTLLQCAVGASAQAIAENNGGIYVYSRNFKARTIQCLQMEADLRHAIEEEQFSLLYQPKVDIKSGMIVGVEALVRWQKADGKDIVPDEFIPLGEESGLIVPLGEWVMKEACRQMLQWQDEGLRIQVAVNISAKQFRGGHFVHCVKDIMTSQGIDPQYLTLELTESLLMENSEQTEEILHHLRNIGVKLSMDDFGTGYSSLSYLKRFPLHELKIDRSFLKDIGNNNREDKALVSAMIYLAHEFGLQVVAEGVEEQEQLNILTSLRCDAYQGYFFSPPVSSEKIASMFVAFCGDNVQQ